MATIFWHSDRVILTDFLEGERIVMASSYKALLRKLKTALARKRRGKLHLGVLFHHDNALAHSSRTVRTVLREFRWEVIPHAPYGPDVAPSDFFLFTKLKEHLKGTLFESMDDAKRAVSTWCNTQPPGFYKEGHLHSEEGLQTEDSSTDGHSVKRGNAGTRLTGKRLTSEAAQSASSADEAIIESEKHACAGKHSYSGTTNHMTTDDDISRVTTEGTDSTKPVAYTEVFTRHANDSQHATTSTTRRSDGSQRTSKKVQKPRIARSAPTNNNVAKHDETNAQEDSTPTAPPDRPDEATTQSVASEPGTTAQIRNLHDERKQRPYTTPRPGTTGKGKTSSKPTEHSTEGTETSKFTQKTEPTHADVTSSASRGPSEHATTHS
ncbi:hypothetical protein M514_28338, partial [Trichuris suis]